jgi:hypothetical protein
LHAESDKKEGEFQSSISQYLWWSRSHSMGVAKRRIECDALTTDVVPTTYKIKWRLTISEPKNVHISPDREF